MREEHELIEKTTLVFSKEALEAERKVIEAMTFPASRKVRYETAIIVLAQILPAINRGDQSIDPRQINLKRAD